MNIRITLIGYIFLCNLTCAMQNQNAISVNSSASFEHLPPEIVELIISNIASQLDSNSSSGEVPPLARRTITPEEIRQENYLVNLRNFLAMRGTNRQFRSIIQSYITSRPDLYGRMRLQELTHQYNASVEQSENEWQTRERE